MRIMTDMVVGPQKAVTDGEVVTKQGLDVALVEQDGFAVTFEMISQENIAPHPTAMVTIAPKAMLVDGRAARTFQDEGPVVDAKAIIVEDVAVGLDRAGSVLPLVDELQLGVEGPVSRVLVPELPVAKRDVSVQKPSHETKRMDVVSKGRMALTLSETPPLTPVTEAMPVLNREHQGSETDVLLTQLSGKDTADTTAVPQSDKSADVRPQVSVTNAGFSEAQAPEQLVGSTRFFKDAGLQVEFQQQPDAPKTLEPAQTVQDDQEPFQFKPEIQYVSPKTNAAMPVISVADVSEQLPNIPDRASAAVALRESEIAQPTHRSNIATDAIPLQKSALVVDDMAPKLTEQANAPRHKLESVRADPPIQSQDRQPISNVVPTPQVAEVTSKTIQPKPVGGEALVLDQSALGGLTAPSAEPARGLTPTLPNPGMPVPVPSAPQQVAYQISQLFKGDAVAEMDIRLDPEELGSIRLVMAPKENGMAVTIYADRPDTLELLRRNSDQLSEHLGELGYSGTEFEFHDQGKGQGGESGRHGTGDDFEPMASAHEAVTRHQIALSDGMDLRF